MILSILRLLSNPFSVVSMLLLAASTLLLGASLFLLAASTLLLAACTLSAVRLGQFSATRPRARLSSFARHIIGAAILDFGSEAA